MNILHKGFWIGTNHIFRTSYTYIGNSVYVDIYMSNLQKKILPVRIAKNLRRVCSEKNAKQIAKNTALTFLRKLQFNVNDCFADYSE